MKLVWLHVPPPGERLHPLTPLGACKVLMSNEVNGDDGPHVEGKGLHVETRRGKRVKGCLWAEKNNFRLMSNYESDWYWLIMIYIDLSTSWKSFHVFFLGGEVAKFQTQLADWGLGGLGLGGECEKNHHFPIPSPTKMISFFFGVYSLYPMIYPLVMSK